MTISQILSFLFTAIVLTFMPGPDNIFVLTESLSKGSRRGLALSFGLNTGILIHTCAVVSGLSVLLMCTEYAFTVIKIFGACYLLFMAYQALIEKPISNDTNIVSEEFSFWNSYKKGVFLNLLNPKIIIFFIAFLPQFVIESSISSSLQMLIFGIIFSVQGLIIMSLIALLAGFFTSLLNSPKFWKITKIIKIVIFILLALFLLFSKKS